jgi:uncharacterized protein
MNLEVPLVRCRWVIAIWVVGFSVAIVGGVMAEVLMAPVSRFWLMMGLFYLSYGGITLGLLLACRSRGIEIRRLIGQTPSLVRLLQYSLTVIPVLLASLGGGWLISQFAPHFFDNFVNNAFGSKPAGPIQIVLSFGMLVVVAPIIEEFTFRGLLFTRFAVKYSPRKAIIMTSLMFGLLHLDFIGAFIFGLVAASMYARSGSLIAPILLHGVNNLVAWAGLMFDSSDDQIPTWFGRIALVAGISISIYLIVSWTRRTMVPPYVMGSILLENEGTSSLSSI